MPLFSEADFGGGMGQPMIPGPQWSPGQAPVPNIPPAYGQPPSAANGYTTGNSFGAGPASQAFRQAANTGGLASIPLPPPRPANLGQATPSGQTGPTDGSAEGDPQSQDGGLMGFLKAFIRAGQSGGSDPSAGSNLPQGSNLAQGPGAPGSGLTSFLGNAFGSQPGQGNILGNTGGQNPQNIFSGDPQSKLPSFMKGSSIGNFLQILGMGGF